jgi:hypothetical protein
MAVQARHADPGALTRGALVLAARWRRGAGALAFALLAGCAGTPLPDWELDAKSAVDAAVRADLQGATRVTSQEFQRARAALARSGRLDLAARAELLRCAARVASLELGACMAFDALAADATAGDRAYARYLVGSATADDIALLPAHHRAAATSRGADAAVLEAMADPLARLVGAAVMLQATRASPDVVGLAVRTASEQGWRRPLLAWLHVQLQAAQRTGELDEAQRVQRRIDFVTSAPK